MPTVCYKKGGESVVKRLRTPLSDEKVRELRAGDSILLSGTIYTARDAAHKRLVALLEEGKDLPIQLKDAIIYYAGPTPEKPGHPVGSIGPTTSLRMDAYTPMLLDRGLKGMIGKGSRSEEVIESMKKSSAVYFAAAGGIAALMSRCVKKAEVVAYEDLGSEAIRRLEVEDMPLVVAIDSKGNDLFKIGQGEYLQFREQGTVAREQR